MSSISDQDSFPLEYILERLVEVNFVISDEVRFSGSGRMN